MLRKLRSDSLWNQLSDEQWATLEGWLFEENLSYQAARERLEKEWGYKRSITNLACFYRRCAQERQLEELPQTLESARRLLQELGAGEGELQAATRLLTAKRLFEQAAQARGLKELALLTRLATERENCAIR